MESKNKVKNTTETKKRILEEALKLFAQYGYVGTSMSDIAGQLNVTKQALYKHYSCKQEILDCLLEKMDEEDRERAKEYQMPQGSMEEIIKGYKQLNKERIKQYTMAQFLHWTEEEFACRFRKMLTIEQYRDEKMAELYQYYLADGPITNMEEIFKGLTHREKDARQIAMEFYGPIFLLYSIYDKSANREEVLKQLGDHVDRFVKQLDDER